MNSSSASSQPLTAVLSEITLTSQPTLSGEVKPSALSRTGGMLTAMLLGLCGISAASAQTQYTVTELAVLPGQVSCVAEQLNNLGDVVGYCAPADEFFNQIGVVWRNGTVSSVGKLSKGNYSVATAINSQGTIAGDGDKGDFSPRSWVTQEDGSLLNFFRNNGGNTHALFMGDNGFIGGYYTGSTSGGWLGAIWTPNPKKPDRYNTRDLPILPGGIDPASSNTIPSAFNQSGQAAGSGSNDQIGQHAVFWNNDAANSIVDLGVYPGDWSSVANGMNDLGQVVGSSHPPFGSRPILWNNNAAQTPIELPVLAGDNYGSATTINNSGVILGRSYYGTPGTWDATPSRQVVWEDGVVFELQSSLDPVTGAGLTLTYASAINNAGQIAATATRADGVKRAILLTPMALP